MEAKLENIEKIISGNGHPGLHETVIELNANVQNLTNSIDKQQKHKRWLITTIVGMSVSMLSLIIELLKRL